MSINIRILKISTHFKKIGISIALLCFSTFCKAIEVPLDIFPIDAYPQNVTTQLFINEEDYHRPLLDISYQKQQLKQFYNHYYSTEIDALSPWSEKTITAILPLVYTIESEQLNEYNNEKKQAESLHYAENFKPQSNEWWQRISSNINLEELKNISYQANQRAIVTKNTNARNLPDQAPDFFHLTKAGQGFPFDNLQDSAIWIGTPIYVISTTQDKAWSLVLTPDAYITWIQTQDLGFASEDFISAWQKYAKQQLIAITKTHVSLLDDDDQFLSSAYIGSVFPLIETKETTYKIAVPFKNKKHQAEINTANISEDYSTRMPMPANKKNMAKLLMQLQNRPYGWGGAFFFNDCSQELKSLFTPLGIWLPRNSRQQSKMGKTLSLSDLNLDERIQAIKTQGHPLMTLLYIPGHIMLYVGNQQNQVLTYQNIWGLSPESGNKRYVIGQSLFFPLLKTYPENTSVISPAAKSALQLIFIDQLPTTTEKPNLFAQQFLSS